MTDRDFKLLVREYFQARRLANIEYDWTKYHPGWLEFDAIEKRILSELEDFTEKEQQELPFKETEI